MKCCICGKEIEGFGNNPDGAMWRDPDTNELVEFAWLERANLMSL